MGLVVGGLSLANGCTSGWSVALGLREGVVSHAEVTVGCIDRTAELKRTVE